MRVALFASPAFALPSLYALAKTQELLLVVSQADKPSGRGMKLQSPATALAAKDLGVALEQPKSLKNHRGFEERLANLKLDLAVTVAYGKILPKSLLTIPRYGFLNVHASLLPKYRGAAPIQWALIQGEKETGISIMQTEEGLDTGPVGHVVRYQIQESDTALSLFDKLADLGALALVEALAKLENASLELIPQDPDKASFAPMLSKEDGRIRWQDSTEAVINRYRGVYAWPGSWTVFKAVSTKVHELKRANAYGKPGSILAISEAGVEVATADGSVTLLTVQPASRAKISAFAWANGYGLKTGDYLG